MYKIYQVEYGDTFDSIAKKTSTTVDDLKVINGYNDDYDLMVGSLIIVPNTKNQYFKMYNVKQGDTIYSIAKMFNIDENTLMLLNGLKEEEYIYPNQEIMIPNDDIYVYITKEGDTIKTIGDFFNSDLNTIANENSNIFVLEDQLIIHKKV